MLLFETERLLVKRFTQHDADAFFNVNGNEQVMQYIRPVKSREESDSFLTENLNLYQNGSIVGRFAVFTRGHQSFVGTFSFLYLSDAENFHIGYALIEEAWGKGYATELVKNGIRYFFDTTAKETLYAITEAANAPSQKVLLKAGLLANGHIIEHDKILDLYTITREQAGAVAQ